MDLATMNTGAKVGRNVRVDADEIDLGSNVVLGDNVVVEARRVVLGNGAQIDEGVVVRAETLELGHGSRIGARAQLGGMRGVADLIRIGEQTLVAHDCKLIVRVAVIGDYTAIHNHTLLNGVLPLVIGHGCWIGQNCVINSEDRLTIGNFVGIGAYSSVYTHGYFGDMLEGCNVFKVAPVELKDDAWILGSYNIISPGVTIGRKALVLTGSNVTKDVPDNHTVGGAPAKDITERLVPYRVVSPADKLVKIREYLAEYVEKVFPGRHEASDHGFVVDAPFGPFTVHLSETLTDGDMLPRSRPLLAFTTRSEIEDPLADITVFDLSKRTYTRTRSEAEISTISFLKSYRARFVPADNPRVTAPEEYSDP